MKIQTEDNFMIKRSRKKRSKIKNLEILQDVLMNQFTKSFDEIADVGVSNYSSDPVEAGSSNRIFLLILSSPYNLKEFLLKRLICFIN